MKEKIVENIDPIRTELFIKFRQDQKFLFEIKQNRNFFPIFTTTPFNQNLSKISLVGLKPIYFNEMEKVADREYKQSILTGTIVDEIQFQVAVHMILEDENKDVLRTCIYNLGDDFNEIRKRYEIGTVLQIVNPFLRIGLDGVPFIKVQEPKNVILIEKKVKICRYCGKENAPVCCQKCRKALYCSDECKKKDLRFLGHSLICQEKDSEQFSYFFFYFVLINFCK